MRKSLLILAWFIVTAGGVGFSQQTTTTGTFVDPDGTAWNAGTYSIQYVNSTPGKPYNTSTGAFITTLYTGSLNSSGALSLTLDDVKYVSPANGTWAFTICPNVSGGASNCSTVDIPVTGATENVSTLVNAALKAPRPGGGVGAYGYADVEFQAIPNNTYVVSPALTVARCYAGSWAVCGGGGGGSLPSGTGVVKVTSGTGALASPITDYQVPLGVSLANYNASNLPVTYGNVTNASNVVTVVDAAGWSNGMGIFIPAVSATAGYPASGVHCDNVTVSGNTITMLNVGGSACNAGWTSGSNSVPVFHFDMTHGAITSSTASLVVGSAATFSAGQGIMVAGAGAAGADLITTISSISGTTLTLAANAGTTVTVAQVFHDDTAALAAALTAAGQTPGSSVRVPTGAYFLSSENDITNAITLYGDGMYQSAFIVTENGINAIVAKSSGITVKDVGLYQSEAYTPTSGVLLSDCDTGATDICFNDNFTRLMLYGGWDQFDVFNKTIQGSFTYSTLHKPFHSSIYVNNVGPYGDINFDSDQLQACGSPCTNTATGILIDAADADAWNSMKINSYGTDNIKITGATGQVDHQRFVNLSSEGGDISIAKSGANPVFGTSFTGGEFEFATGMTIGNNVTRTSITGTTTYGGTNCFDISGQNGTFTGNTVEGCSGDGLDFESTATNNTAESNTFQTIGGYGINNKGTLTTNTNSYWDNQFISVTSGNFLSADGPRVSFTRAPTGVTGAQSVIDLGTGSQPIMEYLAPNLPNGGFKQVWLGQSLTAGNAADYGFWNVGSNNPCNSNFMGVFGFNTLTVANDGNVGIGVALGTCPSSALQVVGTVSATGLNITGARKGTFVCTNAGTITISNANELITSDVIISMNTAGGTITTPPAMKTVTSGTGFTVLCGATDTSTYNYDILN